MAYSIVQVRPLLSTAELQLFEASRADAIKRLTPVQLRGKITRSRNMRDKFTDLYRRQTVETQRTPGPKRAPKGGENARTQQKVEIFAEVLRRFEAQRDKLQAAAEKEKARAAKQAEKEKRRAKKAQSVSGIAGRKSGMTPKQQAMSETPTGKPAVSERLNLLKSKPLNKKIHAAARASKKRYQAKRDAR